MERVHASVVQRDGTRDVHGGQVVETQIKPRLEDLFQVSTRVPECIQYPEHIRYPQHPASCRPDYLEYPECLEFAGWVP